MTLFIHDRECGPDCLPGSKQLEMLLRQTPMVVWNADGSRTFVFDLPEEEEEEERVDAGVLEACGGERLRKLS